MSKRYIDVNDFKEFLIPTLNYLYQLQRPISKYEIDCEVLQSIPKDQRNNYYQYTAWARTYLKKYGLIVNQKRGYWIVSECYHGEVLVADDIICAVRNHQQYEGADKENDIKQNNQNYIEEVHKAFTNKLLVPFIGAGVSMAANLPSWDQLLFRLAYHIMFYDKQDLPGNHIKQELHDIIESNKENSPIIQTRMLMQNIPVENKQQLLLDSLYEKQSQINLDNALLQTLLRFIRRENKINIDEIVTFNFDNLLEQCMKQEKIAYNCIYHEADNKQQDRINIYHVHGYLGNDIDPDEADLDELVFSEEQYHRRYNDSYHWSNMKQISFLREKICLFIGCSLSDPNIRRLLDIAKQDNKYHYAIMKKEAVKRPAHIQADSLAYRIYEQFYLQRQNEYFKGLGIRVIWVDEFAQIPQILKDIAGIS